MPTTASFTVVLDKYTAEVDPVLGFNAGGKFTLGVNPTSVVLSPIGAPCCSPGPMTVTLDAVKRIETIPATLAQPGLLLEYVAGEETVSHKFWLLPGKGKALEEELAAAIQFVLASKKLYSGEVLVAGALPSTLGGAPVMFDAPEAQLINATRAALLTKAPGATETLTMVSGVPGGKMKFERYAYTVKITFDTSAIAGEDEIATVFCKPITSMETPFPMVEVKTEAGKVWELDFAPVPTGKTSKMVTFEPTQITMSPHLWDKIMPVPKTRAASSSIASRMSLRGPSLAKAPKEPKKKEVKKEEEVKEEEVKEEEVKPPEPEPKVVEPTPPADAEPEPADAAPKASPRSGIGRFSLGGKKKKEPKKAEPEPEPEPEK